MTTTVVSSGVTSVALTVNSGDTLALAGGTAVTTLVDNGGQLIVSAGGLASGTGSARTQVFGSETVLAGGIASWTVVSGGGEITVSSGGLSRATWISAGGSAAVYGSVGGVVFAGGHETVYAGGSAFVTDYGEVDVASGGTAAPTTYVGYNNSGGLLVVLSGGLVSGAPVSSGGTNTWVGGGGQVVISAGGLADGVTVSSGGIETVYGSAVGGEVRSLGGEAILSGGFASGLMVDSGGLLLIDGTASVMALMLQSGATIDVRGVSATSAGLDGSGDLVLTSGGVVVETMGLAAGWGGYALSVQSDGVGGTEVLVGSAIVVVTSGQTEIVSSGQTVGGAIILSSGALNVLNHGAAIGTVVSSGGWEYVFSGGVASGGVVSNGGSEQIVSGGTASGVVISSGGQIVLPVIAPDGAYSSISASLLSGITVQSGGIVSLTIYAGGSISGFVVDGVAGRNALELIFSGGMASATVVSSGGIEYVLSGGVDSGGIVLSGGALWLSSGAVAGGLSLQPGAVIDLMAVAATSASVNNSGQLVATSGGVVVDTIGLAAGAGGYSFSTQSDGAGGTEILVGSNSAPPVANDFLGLGSSDILWRNTATGEVDVWLSTPGSAAAFTGQGITDVATNWTIEATGDLHGNGLDDLIWRNTSNGEVDVWTTSANGSSVSFAGQGLSVVPLNWQLQQQTADFTGDGLDDLAWRNTTTGELDLWLTNPGSPLTFTEQGLAVVPMAFAIQSFGDFNGDGKADILWRNTSTGELDIWTSNPGSTVSFTGQGIGIVPLNETIVGVGDFTGDGRADILWLNTTTGELDVWLTNPSSPGAPVTFTEQGLSVIPSTMSVAQVGDFTGDGRADILWRNSGNGDAYLWLSNPGSTVSFTGQDLGVVPASFQIVSDWHGA